MSTTNPSSTTEVVPYMFKDLEGHVIYAHPDYDLVVLRAWVDALQQSRVFISTSKDIIKILFDVQYQPNSHQSLYLKFDGMLTDDFGVIVKILSWEKRDSRLEVSVTEIAKSTVELGDQPNTSCLQHNAQKLLTETDGKSKPPSPEMSDECREKMLISPEQVNRRLLKKSKGMTINGELNSSIALQEASSSQQMTSMPMEFKDLLSISPAMLSDSQLFILMSDFLVNPPLYNRVDYPFVVDGFICQESDAMVRNEHKMITVYTRRLGPIVVQDMECRNANPYTRFMCIGPDAYRAFEFDSAHPSFKSTKFVSALQVECKGYALMGKGNRNNSESKWLAWSDHTGLMRCVTSCARTLKKKYGTWQPTLQMVMFDASSRDGGKNWEVKTINYLDYEQATKNDYWPQHAYFVPDLTLQDGQQPENRELYFTSEILDDPVRARSEHVELSGIHKEHYGAVVVPEWSSGMMGLVRSFKAIMVAPLRTWTTNRAFHVVANRLRQYKKTDLWTCPPLLNETIGDYSASTPFIQKQLQSGNTTFVDVNEFDAKSLPLSRHFETSNNNSFRDINKKNKFEERNQQHQDWETTVVTGSRDTDGRKQTTNSRQTSGLATHVTSPTKQISMRQIPEQNLPTKLVSRFRQQSPVQKQSLTHFSSTQYEIEEKQEAIKTNASSRVHEQTPAAPQSSRAPLTVQELFNEPAAAGGSCRSAVDPNTFIKLTGGFGKPTRATDGFVTPQTGVIKITPKLGNAIDEFGKSSMPMPDETHSERSASVGFGSSADGRTGFSSSTTTAVSTTANAQKTTAQLSTTATDKKPKSGFSRFTAYTQFNTSTTNSTKREDRRSLLDLPPFVPLSKNKSEQVSGRITPVAQLNDVKTLSSRQAMSPQVQQATSYGGKCPTSEERLFNLFHPPPGTRLSPPYNLLYGPRFGGVPLFDPNNPPPMPHLSDSPPPPDRIPPEYMFHGKRPNPSA